MLSFSSIFDNIKILMRPLTTVKRISPDDALDRKVLGFLIPLESSLRPH